MQYYRQDQHFEGTSFSSLTILREKRSKTVPKLVPTNIRNPSNNVKSGRVKNGPMIAATNQATAKLMAKSASLSFWVDVSLIKEGFIVFNRMAYAKVCQD